MEKALNEYITESSSYLIDVTHSAPYGGVPHQPNSCYYTVTIIEVLKLTIPKGVNTYCRYSTVLKLCFN